ncbi:MAG: cytochrome c biogenesis protein ResB [Micromonosporaceae bacterium]
MTIRPPTRVAAPAAEETAGAGPAGSPQAGPHVEAVRQAAKPFGIIGWLRWFWRQLTSMRTALVLLFLLAVASVPGSMLPQNGTDPAKVSQYISQHPLLGPILNRLSLFDVFAAPWFAAIYLLLFTSLAGCVLPRAFRLAVSARAQPPVAPRHPARLPFGSRYAASVSPSDALAAATRLLAGKRFRLRAGDGWIAAEKGYLRETGNLIFHIALLALLAAIGVGALFGYKADLILTEGDGFANTIAAFDQYHPGRAVAPGDLQPFSVWLDRFHASYIQSGPLRGQPSSFAASIRYTGHPGAAMRHYDLQVNHPLNVDGAKVYLIGHGYAPVFRVTDGRGQVAFEGAVPFLPTGDMGATSEGVVKVPDARPQQLGFVGVFLPTAVDNAGRLSSAFPAPISPAVSLVSYAGNLGLDSGAPQSVYQLDTSGLRRLPVAPRPLFAGQSMKLPNGTGTVTFTGFRQWISVQVTYDPGRFPALVSAATAIFGLLLSFLVRRRRVFVRVRPAGAADEAAGGPPTGAGDSGLAAGARAASADGRGGCEVEFGGLARSDVAGGFEEEYAALAAALGSALGSAPESVPESAPGSVPESARGSAPPGTEREPAAAEAVAKEATTSEDRK